MKKIILATLGMGLLAVGFNASAATATGTISASLDVSAVCSVDTGGFDGTFTAITQGVVTAQSTASSDVKVNCLNEPYKFSADGGANALSDKSKRQLKEAVSGDSITYSIALTPPSGFGSAITSWGDGTTITGTTANQLSGAVVGLAAGETYAIVINTDAILASSSAGTYQDTITLTVEW